MMIMKSPFWTNRLSMKSKVVGLVFLIFPPSNCHVFSRVFILHKFYLFTRLQMCCCRIFDVDFWPVSWHFIRRNFICEKNYPISKFYQPVNTNKSWLSKLTVYEIQMTRKKIILHSQLIKILFSILKTSVYHWLWLIPSFSTKVSG